MQPTKAWAAGGDVNFRQCYGCGAETYGAVLCADCRQDPAYRDAVFFLEAPPIETLGAADDPPVGHIGRAIALTIVVGVILGAGVVWAARLMYAAAHWWHTFFGG